MHGVYNTLSEIYLSISVLKKIVLCGDDRVLFRTLWGEGAYWYFGESKFEIVLWLLDSILPMHGQSVNEPSCSYEIFITI